jgi:hypothetical protein
MCPKNRSNTKHANGNCKGIEAGKRVTDKMRARGGNEEKVENERDREEEGKEQKEQGEEWRREEWGEGIEIGTEPRVQLKTAAPLTVREAVRRQVGRWTSLKLEADRYDGYGDNKKGRSKEQQKAWEILTKCGKL